MNFRFGNFICLEQCFRFSLVWLDVRLLSLNIDFSWLLLCNGSWALRQGSGFISVHLRYTWIQDVSSHFGLWLQSNPKSFCALWILSDRMKDLRSMCLGNKVNWSFELIGIKRISSAVFAQKRLIAQWLDVSWQMFSCFRNRSSLFHFPAVVHSECPLLEGSGHGFLSPSLAGYLFSQYVSPVKNVEVKPSLWYYG